MAHKISARSARRVKRAAKASVKAKVIEMDDGKFARMTANLLVRKGEAEPSAVQLPEPNGRGRSHSGTVVRLSGFAAPSGVFSRTAKKKAPAKQRKIMVELSSEEHETLGLVGAKNGFTPHQIIRHALDSYFAWLADEYGSQCRCIASTCSTECDHLSAAEEAELLARDRQTD